MHHLPHLITDLGVILIIAALSTLLFKRLGQPLVLGYLIAGFLVSPHVPFLPTVTDNDSIKVWSEIGVIFLLFSLGLEFSFKKLFKVGGSASFTATFEVVFMLGLGFLVGRLLGWNNIDSLFFGGILSISSTTIIVRAFHELGLKGQKFVDLVFGILVVEDIVAILLLVLLAAIAGTDAVSGMALVSSAFRLLFYIALWFVVGIFLIPIFLRKTRSLLEDETTLLVAMGLCFMMVIIAAAVGFSPALGAFVMGSLLAETPEGHRMEHLFQPVKNLFAAIFFVSVGMMIDPKVLIDRWDLVILVTLITIGGKFISTVLGALLSGQARKQSVQAGLSLAQIGEFSFIIASLGVTLKVTSDFLYPLAIAVSAVTTFTTPYLIKFAEPFYNWVDPKIPQGIKHLSDRYHDSFKHPGKDGIGSLIMKSYGLKILLNTVIIVAIIGGFKSFLLDDIQALVAESSWAGGLSLLICLLVSSPFFWGLIMGGPSLSGQRELEAIQKLKGLQVGIFVGRIVLALALLSVLISQFLSLKMASGVGFGALVLAIIFGQFWVRRLYQFIEINFLKNLTERERKELVSADLPRKFLPWDANLSTFEIQPHHSLVGRSLSDCNFKEKFHVTVAAVTRGSRKIFAPAGDFVIWPHDRLICFGNEEQLTNFNDILEAQIKSEPSADNKSWEEFQLKSLAITSDSPFCNKTIRDSGFRASHMGMVVGIERGAKKILAPASHFILQENDLVWAVSDQKNP